MENQIEKNVNMAVELVSIVTEMFTDEIFKAKLMNANTVPEQIKVMFGGKPALTNKLVNVINGNEEGHICSPFEIVGGIKKLLADEELQRLFI